MSDIPFVASADVRQTLALERIAAALERTAHTLEEIRDEFYELKKKGIKAKINW